MNRSQMSQTNSDTQQPLAFLDRIPDSIYQPLITHRYRSVSGEKHSFRNRCLGVIELRDCLLGGQPVNVESLQTWLDQQAADALLQWLESHSFDQYSVLSESQIDQFIRDMLNWLNDMERRLSSPEPSAKQTDSHSQAQSTDVLDNKPDTSSVNEHKTQHKNYDAMPDGQSELAESQSETSSSSANIDTKSLQQMQSLYQSFGIERQVGMDLNEGISSQLEMDQILRLYRRIRSSRYLQAVIDQLGRSDWRKVLQSDDADISVCESVGCHDQPNQPDQFSINRVSGVHYGDDLSRMLPSQLALLGHPKFKSLWHARRAERQLLNYHIEGVMSDHEADWIPPTHRHGDSGTVNIKAAGPMIVCIDTSASMRGDPEIRARAVLLEIMRRARLQQRPCYMIAFSSQDEILERRLDLELSGWRPYLDFISHSYNGGTDIDAVIQRACKLLMQSENSETDILILSDGLFSFTDQSALSGVRQHYQDMRIYGFQLSRWKNTGFDALCDQVYLFDHV